MITYKILTRPDRKNKSGWQPLVLNVTINRKVAQKNLGFYAPKNTFNPITQKLPIKPDYALINAKLSEIKNKAEQLVYYYNINIKPVTPTEFINQVLGIKQKEKQNQLCFFTFFEKYIMQRNVELKRLQAYKSFIAEVKQFNSTLLLTQVNYKFCTHFFSHLQLKKNHNNTQIKKLKILKLTLNEAYKLGVIAEQPNLNYIIKKLPSNRVALTNSELQTLENLHQANTLPPALNETLKQFLFMCHTGLRYADLKQFNTNLIKENVIYLVQGKTKKLTSVPLRSKAMALLPQTKFNVITNQKTNQNLLKISKLTGISQITCHIARHTFATHALNNGVSLEVVSDTLGHSSTLVTKIYAKMLVNFKIQEFKKWG